MGVSERRLWDDAIVNVLLNNGSKFTFLCLLRAESLGGITAFIGAKLYILCFYWGDLTSSSR